MKNIDVQRYLKQFSDDADISIVIAHPKKRKVYEHEAVLLIADSEVPAFVIAIKRERGMDEEESAACKECEQAAENIKGQMDISDFPEVMP